jgi:biopolymer transport protein ExbD
MAMNVGEAREGEPVSEINTTPLIDVMLVLLIMLIVTLPPQRHAVKLDTPLPCPDCIPLDDLPKPVTISVAFDGRISWNGAPVQREELRQRLAAEAGKPMQAEIHIHPDGSAAYGNVAHVMATAQREGIRKMGVIGGT